MSRNALIASLAGAIALGFSTLSVQAAPLPVSESGLHSGNASLAQKAHWDRPYWRHRYHWYRHHRQHNHYWHHPRRQHHYGHHNRPDQYDGDHRRRQNYWR
jgi:hypothetical protein